MGQHALIIKPGDRGAALDVLGTKVTVLSDGSSEERVTLQSGAEGTGPPPHNHDWDESFFVSGGQISFTCGEETTMCQAGTFVHVPAGIVHSFSYGPGGGEMIELTGPRSHAISMFRAIAREISPSSPDLARAVEVLAEHGCKVHA
jgi:quercetin dioxygenase-like cupin family protein